MHVGPRFILAAIRKKIKDEGLGYSELSNKTGIPLSTIKRHLHSPTLGLDKILMYVNYLNTDLVELSKIANQIQHENAQIICGDLSDLFLDHPYLLDFIYMLTARNLTPEAIAEAHNLDDTSLRFYLRIAEILGYIEDYGDGVIYRSGSRFLTEEGSKLDGLFRQRFQDESLSHPIPANFCIGRIRLTQSQIEQLEQDFYAKLIELNAMNTSRDEGDLINILMRFTPGKQILFSEGLPNIDGTLLKQISERFNQIKTQSQ